MEKRIEAKRGEREVEKVNKQFFEKMKSLLH